MQTFPKEFEALLSARGRRVLAGGLLQGVLSDPQQRFCAETGLIDLRQARAALRLLDAHVYAHLTKLEAPIPPETIYAQTKNYEELLPKTMRQKTAYLERTRGRAYEACREVGLIDCLRSESFVAFCTALAGRPLRKRHGVQVLCYEHGDYAGPHTDHHPEEPAARDGYVDVHVSLANAAVGAQWLVYARRGHFSEVRDIATLGGVTGYRLPFWHYTTPLVGKPGREARARRWLLLGTFLFMKGAL